MSFFRHEEIYRPMDSKNMPGRPCYDRPRPHRYDEFPAGYSSAGCAPAEPASASPAEAHLAGIGAGSTIELQRTVNCLLTPCLTQGDNPTVFVLCKIDEILSWDKTRDRERDSKFVELGRYLCEVRAGQYCRVDKSVRSTNSWSGSSPSPGARPTT